MCDRLRVSCVLLLALKAARSAQRPHIVLLLADDLGWGNVGRHRSGDTPADRQAAVEAFTPHLDALIGDGVELSRHYAYSICAPSRCALQTGRHPLRVNAKNTGVLSANPADDVSGYAGIPTNMTGVAQKLKAAGYVTHFTGKWDAGMATPAHTPAGRGYDSSYGYFQHANGYWDKRGRIESTGAVDLCLNQFHDFFEENATYRGGVLDPAALDASCSADAGPDPPCYAEKLFKDRAVGIIEAHAAVQDASPLFYMHSFHLAHTPLNVPQSYVDAADKRLAAHGFAFDDAGRRNYSAMVSYLDGVVGAIRTSLEQTKMWENTFVAFASDNGGPLYLPGSANNHPHKGGKYSDWEGGLRTVAAVSGGVVPAARRGAAYKRVVAVADWYGMFLNLAGLSGRQLDDAAAAAANPELERRGLPTLYPVEAADGLVWDVLAGGGDGDDAQQQPFHPSLQLSQSALLRWPHKLVTGIQVFSNHTGVLYPNCSTLGGPLLPWYNDSKVFDEHLDWASDDALEREHLWAEDCGSGCLYDVSEDPGEARDLASEQPALLASMIAELERRNADVFLPDRGGDDVAACANGVRVGGYYGPWIASDDYYTGPFAPKTPAEEKTDAEYVAAVEALARPFVEASALAAARALFPGYGRDPLIASFDRCLNGTGR